MPASAGRLGFRGRLNAAFSGTRGLLRCDQVDSPEKDDVSPIRGMNPPRRLVNFARR